MPAKVIGFQVSPRRAKLTDRVWDAIYVLSDAGQVFRYDINPDTKQPEWKMLDLPPEVTQP
jgi:hypothetical protein